ncbi:MAG TPA: molybdenum cofactor guanylyltransferase [Actinomycetota bacterium]
MLAGGRSSRFGRDKLAEPFRGAPLLHHAVARVGELCAEVIVVLAPGTRAPDLPSGARFARDSAEGLGPLAGLIAGLESARSELAIVVGGDMPDVQTRVLLEMVRALRSSSSSAVVLHDGTDARPLPLAVRTGDAARAARTLLDAGRRRLRDLLDALPVVVVDEPTWTALDRDRRSLFDVDVPGDLPS